MSLPCKLQDGANPSVGKRPSPLFRIEARLCSDTERMPTRDIHRSMTIAFRMALRTHICITRDIQKML